MFLDTVAVYDPRYRRIYGAACKFTKRNTQSSRLSSGSRAKRDLKKEFEKNSGEENSVVDRSKSLYLQGNLVVPVKILFEKIES